MQIRDKIAATSVSFYSVEFFPPKDQAEWPEFLNTAKKLASLNPLFASVTCGAGGSSQANTLDIALRLKEECGFEPMAHVTCVGTSQADLGRNLEALQAVGIDNVLALRGDKPKDPALAAKTGDFAHAEDLVRFIHAKYPSFGVGVAGYPTAHPESVSFAADRRYLADKIQAGADLVLTQLFFDSREYFMLRDDLQRLGIEAKIIPGVLPIQSLASIRRTLALCGANIPGKFYLDLEEAHQQGGVEAVRECGLAHAVKQIRELFAGGAPGVHLYTLNRAELCLRLVEEVGQI